MAKKIKKKRRKELLCLDKIKGVLVLVFKGRKTEATNGNIDLN